MTFLGAAVPKAKTFLYMPDEPSRSEFEHIRTLAANVHSNPGPGKTLPVFVTKHWVPELDDSIDIWCAGPQWFDIDRAKQERAKGRSYWTYNGGRPNGPAIVIDAPATEARAMAWAAFKHDIDVYFFWHGVHWRTTARSRASASRTWANWITSRQPRQPNKTGPRLHQRRRRCCSYPGRGEGPSRRGPRPDRAGGQRAAREPAARPAGPPVPRRWPASCGQTAAVDAALRARWSRACSLRRGETVGFHRRRATNTKRAPRPGPGHRRRAPKPGGTR
jgi:hypothetical protein